MFKRSHRLDELARVEKKQRQACAVEETTAMSLLLASLCDAPGPSSSSTSTLNLASRLLLQTLTGKGQRVVLAPVAATPAASAAAEYLYMPPMYRDLNGQSDARQREQLLDQLEMTARERRRVLLSSAGESDVDSGGSSGSDKVDMTGDDGGGRPKPPTSEPSSSVAVRNMRLQQARKRRVLGRQAAADDRSRSAQQQQQQQQAPTDSGAVMTAKAALAERERREQARLREKEVKEAAVECIKEETFERATVTLEEQTQRSVWLFAMFEERQVVVEGLGPRLGSLARVRPSQRESTPATAAVPHREAATPPRDREHSRSTSPAPQSPPASLTHVTAQRTQANDPTAAIVVAEQARSPESSPDRASSSWGQPLPSTSWSPPREKPPPLPAVPDPVVLMAPPPLVTAVSPAMLAAAYRLQTMHRQQIEAHSEKEQGARKRLIEQEMSDAAALRREAEQWRQRFLQKQEMLAEELKGVQSALTVSPNDVASSHKAIEASDQLRRAKDRILGESRAMLLLEEASARGELDDDEAMFYQTYILQPALLAHRRFLLTHEAAHRREVEQQQDRQFMRDVIALHKYFAAVEDMLPNFVAGAEAVLGASRRALELAAKTVVEWSRRLREAGQEERMQRVGIAAQEDECRDLVDRYHAHILLRAQLFRSKDVARGIHVSESFEAVGRGSIRRFEGWAFRQTTQLATFLKTRHDDSQLVLQQMDRTGTKGLKAVLSEISHTIAYQEDAERYAQTEQEKAMRGHFKTMHVRTMHPVQLLDEFRKRTIATYTEAQQANFGFFERLRKEAADVRRVVSTLFFTPAAETGAGYSVGSIDTTGGPCTNDTVDLLLAMVGGRQCHVDRLVVARGVPAAVKLLALDCRSFAFRHCGMRDEHLTASCSFVPQWAETALCYQAAAEGSSPDAKPRVTYSSPMEHLKFWQQRFPEPPGAGEAQRPTMDLDIEGNDLGSASYEILVHLLREPAAGFFVEGAQTRNDGMLPYQKCVLQFLTRLNRSMAGEKKRRAAESASAGVRPETAADPSAAATSTDFAAFGPRTDLQVLDAFRTFLGELVAPSASSTCSRSPAVNTASEGRVLSVKLLKLPKQGVQLQAALGVIFEACRLDTARQLESSAQSIKSIDMSWLGLSDTDVPFIVSNIFAAPTATAVGLRSLDFSNNFFSKTAVTAIEAALRDSPHYDASTFTLHFNGNLNSQDVYQHEATERSRIDFLELRERAPLVHYSGHHHETFMLDRTYVLLQQSLAGPTLDRAEKAVVATRALSRQMHDVVFEETVVRRSMVETYMGQCDTLRHHSTHLNDGVRVYAAACDVLERAHRLAVASELGRSALALQKIHANERELAAHSAMYPAFRRFHTHIEELDRLVHVVFPERCSLLFGADEEKIAEIRLRLAHQPKALREAAYRTMQPLRFFDAPTKESLDLSRPAGVHVPPQNDHVVSNFSIPIIVEAVQNSHTTPHPIRHLSLRNCCGLIDMDTALPALIELCPLLESIDLTNCGLANRHVEALCALVNKHSPQSAAGGQPGLLTSLYLGANNFSLSDMHQILAVMRDSDLPLMELGDESRAHELGVKSVMEHVNFYSALNGRRNAGFKAKALAIARDDPFFTHVSFDAEQLDDGGFGASSPAALRLSQASSPFHSPARRNTETLSGASSPQSGSPVKSAKHLDVVDDETLPLLLYALSQNTHILNVSIKNNKLTDDGVASLTAFLEPRIATTVLTSVQIDGNPCSAHAAARLAHLFQQKVLGVCDVTVVQPEAAARTPLAAALLLQHRGHLVTDYTFMQDWLKAAAVLEADAVVMWNRVMLSAFRGIFSSYTSHEAQVRSVVEQNCHTFFLVAFEYFTLVNMIVPWAKHYADMKHAFVEEAVESLDTVRNIVRSLDPSLQAMAIHIARDNPFVDTLDFSEAFVNDADGNKSVDAIAQLMRMNTHIRELSFANAGPYINSNRSIPVIAEMGLRLEALDLTNCGITDALIGSLSVMIADPKCQLQTLILDGNRVTARGAQKLAKAIRQSKTLALVSLAGNPQMSRDANQLIRFYCDLNKYTPAFKETILRVEANDPTLTEINFERRGNTNEKTIFDDTSMRLLCAALPHNTAVRRLFISGNHVTDDGAFTLINLLTANVNRAVSHVDLSGNDVSSEVLDEVNRLPFYRIHDVVRLDIVLPEIDARELIMKEEQFFFSVALFSLFHNDMMLQIQVDEFLHHAGKYFRTSVFATMLHYHAVRLEEQRRIEIELDMARTRQLLSTVHHYLLTEAHALYVLTQRRMRLELSASKQAIDELWDLLQRQPNEELRRQALPIAINDPRCTHLDLSTNTGTSSDDTLRAAMLLLATNTSVTSLTLAGNMHLARDTLRRVLTLAASQHRLEQLDLSYCNLGDDMLDIIEETLFHTPGCTLRSVNLNGNSFSDRAAAVLVTRYTRTATAAAADAADFPRPPRVSCKSCPLVLDSTSKSVEFAVEVTQCPDAVRNLIVRVLEDDPALVDASQIPMSEDELKWLCLAVSKVKRTRGMRILSSGITDIGASYLVKLVRSMPLLLAVQIIGTLRSMSSIAREELRQVLQLKLQQLLEDEVYIPESLVRCDIAFDEAHIARFLKHYAAVGRLVTEHYNQGVLLFGSWSGSQLAASSILPTEEEARRAVVALYAKETRIYERFHKQVVALSGTCSDLATACQSYLDESRAVIDEAVRRFVVKQCRDLRWKAFSFALNDLTITTLNLSCSWQFPSTTKVLRLFVKHNTHLKELNVSSNDIVDLDALLNCLLELCCPLTSLNLSNCGLKDSHFIESIVPFLQDPRCRVERLVLDRNPLTAMSLAALLASLRESSHRVWDVTGKFTEDGPKDSIVALKFLLGANAVVARARAKLQMGATTSSSLREDLVRLKLTLVDCYYGKTFLSTLNFTDDVFMQTLGLDDAFVAVLSLALERNTKVRSLNVQNHHITNAGAALLLPILSRGDCAIRSLLLDGNFIDDAMFRLLRLAIELRDDLNETAIAVKQIQSHKERCFDESADLLSQLDSVASAMLVQQARARDVVESLEGVKRALFHNYFSFLRFCLAWDKSYHYAFEKHLNEASATLPAAPLRQGSPTSISGSPTRRRASTTSALKDPRIAELPEGLASQYTKFVMASAIYEDKCVAALERVLALASQYEKQRRSGSSEQQLVQAPSLNFAAFPADDSTSSPRRPLSSGSAGFEDSLNTGARRGGGSSSGRYPAGAASSGDFSGARPGSKPTSAGSPGFDDFPFPSADGAKGSTGSSFFSELLQALPTPASPTGAPVFASPVGAGQASQQQPSTTHDVFFNTFVPDADLLELNTSMQRTVTPMVGDRSTPTARDSRPASSKFARVQTPTRVNRSLEPAPFTSPAPSQQGQRAATPSSALPPRPQSSGVGRAYIETLEGQSLVAKLTQRYAKYEAQVESFEGKCNTVLQALYDQYLAVLSGAGDASPAPAPGSPLPPAPRAATGANAAIVAKLQERFDRYIAGVETFTEKCNSLRVSMFDKDGAALAKRRPLPGGAEVVGSPAPTAAEVSLIREQTAVQILRAPEAKLEQVFRVLPAQPVDLQQKARSLVENDRTVTAINLSQATNGTYDVTDITIGVLYTVLQGNDSLKAMSFAGGALRNVSPASIKALLRMALRLESLDLSGARIAEPAKLFPQLLASPTLKTLVLDDCELTGDMLSQILAMLRAANTSLCQLSLKNIPTTIDKNLISFAVYYVECNKQTAAIPAFKDLILKVEANDPSVTSLKGFAFNANFSDASLRLLCIALTRNTLVTVLDLSRTSITDKGCRFLATLMKTSKALMEVSVSGCPSVTEMGKEELKTSTFGGRIALSF